MEFSSVRNVWNSALTSIETKIEKVLTPQQRRIVLIAMGALSLLTGLTLIYRYGYLKQNLIKKFPHEEKKGKIIESAIKEPKNTFEKKLDQTNDSEFTEDKMIQLKAMIADIKTLLEEYEEKSIPKKKHISLNSDYEFLEKTIYGLVNLLDEEDEEEIEKPQSKGKNVTIKNPDLLDETHVVDKAIQDEVEIVPLQIPEPKAIPTNNSETNETQKFVIKPLLPADQEPTVEAKESVVTTQNDLREKIKSELKKDGWYLSKLTPEQKNDKELVTLAIEQNPWVFRYASIQLRGDYNLVLMVVKRNGMLLEHAAPELKFNYRIVETAVRNNGLALQYAHDDLRNHLDIVHIAIESDRRAFEFASQTIRGHKPTALLAISSKYPWLLQKASLELRKDPELQKLTKGE